MDLLFKEHSAAFPDKCIKYVLPSELLSKNKIQALKINALLKDVISLQLSKKHKKSRKEKRIYK